MQQPPPAYTVDPNPPQMHQQYQYPQAPQPGMPSAPVTVMAPGPAVSSFQTVHQQTTYGAVDKAGCKYSGGGQVAVGFLCVVFGIVSVSIDCQYAYIGTAIWGGIWFGVGGIIGLTAIKASGSSAQCQLTGYFVLNCFSVLYATDIFITMCIALANEPGNSYYGHSSRSARLAIDSILMLLSIAEILLAFWGSAVALKTTCTSRTQSVVTSQPITAYSTNVQPGMYPSQGVTVTTMQYSYNPPQPAQYQPNMLPGGGMAGPPAGAMAGPSAGPDPASQMYPTKN